MQRVSETGWNGSGGGCSVDEPAQVFQTSNGAGLCGAFRGAPDISAVGDPNTGVPVVDTGNFGYYFGVVGGTSLSTPVMAGILADVLAARIHFGKPEFGAFPGFQNYALYSAFKRSPAYFYFDVISGNNSQGPPSPAGYSAGLGYDLVTGMGVLKGVGAANPFFGLVYPAPVGP